jgi:hypothetical protein
MNTLKLCSVFASGAMILASGGCGQQRPPQQNATATEAAAAPGEGGDYGLPSFVGRMWMTATYGQPRGSIRIFLPDKTLLIDSCFETYRIVEWGVVSENTIRWREETVPVEAQYEQPTPDRLILRIAGLDEEQTYVAASAPYVCPDMPR